MDELDALLRDLQTSVPDGSATDSNKSLPRPEPKPKVGHHVSSSPRMLHTAIANASNANSPNNGASPKQQGVQRNKVSQTLNSSLNELDTLLNELSSSQFVDQILETKKSGDPPESAVQQMVRKLSQQSQPDPKLSSTPSGSSTQLKSRVDSNSSLPITKADSDASLSVSEQSQQSKQSNPEIQSNETDGVILRGRKAPDDAAAANVAKQHISVITTCSEPEPNQVAQRSLNKAQTARVSAELSPSSSSSPQKPADSEYEYEQPDTQVQLPVVPLQTTIPICAGCNKAITSGQLLTALNRTWHANHFACAQCEDALGTSSFFERNGKPYCEGCYVQLYSARCAKCLEPVVDRCVTALNKTWHVEHFCCAACGCTFDSVGFLVHDDKPYCPTDYYETFGMRCGGCKRPITDRFVTALNSYWHQACFVCHDCRKPFADGVFNELDGAPYCTAHYNSRRGAQCATCGKAVSGRCVAALYRKYHPECFRCAFCNSVLNRGVFKEFEDRPYCNDCHGKFVAVLRD